MVRMVRRSARCARGIGALLLLALAAIAGAAEHPLTLSAERELLATATIDGVAVRFLIDTGSNASVLDQGWCATRRLATKAGRGSTTGIHGARQGLVLLAERIAIAGPGAGWSDFLVVDLGRRNREAEQPVVGLLGSDYLLARKAIVDLGRRVLILPEDAPPEGQPGSK